MRDYTAIDLYNAVMRDQSLSWACPICRHAVSLRKEDGTGSIFFRGEFSVGRSDHQYLRSLGSIIYTASIMCPECLHFVNYIGEYSNCEEETHNTNYPSEPSYNTDKNSVVFDGLIYPENANSNVKTFVHVPAILVKDYQEMAKLINISPGAAVAFGRRCLERLIITKWPEVREQHKRNFVPHLSEMIRWLKNNHPEVIESDVMEAIKIIGDKAIHVFDTDTDIEIYINDAIMLKTIIEDLLSTYFEEEQKKIQRRNIIRLRSSELKAKSRKLEKGMN